MGITMILSLLSGVALFLYGMALMGDSLKKVAGNKLELILYKLTNSPIKGLLLGTVVTAIIQSSSATTVMVVGFVNSGMMKVAQAIGIIMGANIGTSITGWILCLSYIDGSSGIAQLLSTATISAIVAIIGIILRTFVKKKPYTDVGDIMLGFAILMVGMQTMSGAVSPLKENPHFVSLLTMFKNPFMGILVGIAFTAVLQMHLLLSVSCRHCRSLVRLLLQQLFRSPWESVSVQPVLFCSLPSERTRMENVQH